MRFVVLVCIGIGIAPQFSRAESFHSLAKMYAEQNDVNNAGTHFGLALKNATPEQVAEVASDYVAFLMDRGDLHKAELILRQAQTQLPHDKELKELLARCLILQEKVIEGLRYLKSIYPDTVAREKVAAIYREQGNWDMLVTIEQKWGLKRSEPLRSEPLHVASTQIPALPKKEIVPIPSLVSTSPPVRVSVSSLSRRTAVMPEGPVVPPFMSEIRDTSVLIPFPNSTLPLSLAASFPKPALVPKSPLSLPESPPTLDKLTLVNPIKLSGLPEVVPSTDRYPPRPATALRPRIYAETVAADDFDNLEVSYPIKQAAAFVPVQ